MMVHTLWKRAGICRVSTQRMVGGGRLGGGRLCALLARLEHGTEKALAFLGLRRRWRTQLEQEGSFALRGPLLSQTLNLS